VRIGPDDDETDVAAAQLREVAGRLAEAGHWRPGDPDIVIVLDSGYNPARLAWLLADLPVLLVARVRASRVFYGRVPPRAPGAPGRPPRHGTPVRCGDPATWAGAAVTADARSPRYGPLAVTAWHRVHQKLDRRASGWEHHQGTLPVIEGTLIRLAAIRQAPGCQPLEPMWLWSPHPRASAEEITLLWQAYLRRFDLEHTFRFIKSRLGWNKPLLRDPRGRGPVDLADHRLLRPAAPGPPAGRCDPAALAAPAAAGSDDPRPGPRRIPPRPPGHRQPRQAAETRQARARPARRIEEQDQGTPPARRQKQPDTPETCTKGKTDRLNGKL
jgi:hypothetical protein